MAEDIKQTLGFDAAQALEALKFLDTSLATIETRLNSLASGFTSFNARAGKTVSALKQIASSANSAATALEKANAAQGQSSTGSGTKSSGGTTSNSKLLQGQAAVTAFNQLLGQTGTAAQNAAAATAAATNQIGTTTATNMGKGTAANAKFTVSWETLSRVVQTQFIVRALSALRNAFGSAVEDAIEFQRAVARIQTIAPGASFDAVASGVRNISDSFNIPLLQAAEGVYQAVSNQVGNLGESLAFTATAAQFAKATNSTLADSIDLISGAIKSFDLDVGAAERVANIFFTAIDKGRVTASELANTFGRIGPSAHQVGISLEELAGAVDVISIKGVKTNEALTQFRGIVTALTKPTDAMKAKLAEFGFSSVEAAVATLRLDGLLEKLRDSTHDSSQEFAQLFPNVRGLGGALSVTGKNLTEFAADIRTGEQAVSDLTNQKFGTVFKTDAEKVTTAVNKIKNALTVDFGQEVLASAAHLLELVGGIDNFITAGKFMVSAGARVAVTLGAMVLALQAARLAAIGLSSSLGPLGVILLAISALPAVQSFVDDRAINRANKALDELTTKNAEAQAQFVKAERIKLDAAKKADEDRVRGTLSAIADINVEYLKDVKNGKSANKALVEDTEKSLDKIVNARVKFIAAIDKALEDSRESVRDSNRRIVDLQSQKSDLKFTRDTSGFTDAQKVFALVRRSSDLAKQAESDLGKAFRSGNKADQDAAQKLFEKAETQLSAASGLAKGDKGLESKVFNEQNGLLDKRVQIEQRINQLQVQRQAALKLEKANQEKVVTELRKQSQIALDNTGVFDKEGKQFNDKQLKARSKARVDALKEIAKLGFQQKDFDVAKALGLGDFIQKIQDDVTQRPVAITFSIENAIAKLQADINKSLAQVDAKLPFLADLEKALGKSLRGEGLDEFNNGIAQAQGEADILRNKLSQVGINDKSITNSKREIAQILKSLDSPARADARDFNHALQFPNLATDPAQIAAGKGVVTLRNDLVKLATQSTITQEELDAVQAKALQLGKANLAQLPEDINQLKRLFDIVVSIKAAQDKKTQLDLPKDPEGRLNTLDTVLRNLQASNPGVALSNAAVALQNTVVPVQTIETSVGQSATDAERIAAAYVKASEQTLPQVNPNTFGALQGFNAGGLVKYFDRGGFAAKGTDTIPAMLSPGEFVINARSTKKFYSQLQAINAGIQPVYRAEGGSVSTTNIGDVSISVNGAHSPKLVAREVMQAIVREKRRGSARL